MELSEREIELLRESTRIKFYEGPEIRKRQIVRKEQIPTIEFGRSEIIKAEHGYAEVLRQIKDRAMQRQPIDREDLKNWQRDIVQEQKQYGMSCHPDGVGRYRTSSNPLKALKTNPGAAAAADVPRLMEDWFVDFFRGATRCMVAPSYYDATLVAEVGGTLMRRFEKAAPFAAGNGCLSRVLLTYFCYIVDQPVVVFTIDDRKRFLRSLSSAKSVQRMIADKLRAEPRCACGNIATRVHHLEWMDTYQCGDCNKIFRLQWNSLRKFT